MSVTNSSAVVATQREHVAGEKRDNQFAARTSLVSGPIVEIHGCTKRFGTTLAVDGLDLTVPRGEIYGFIGPNGSGKTTTMRMILRIYQPDEGRVVVFNQDQGRAADDRVGYLPEERGLYRRMTVAKLLRYFAKLKGIRDPNQRVTEQLKRLGAKDWANMKVEQLSKGMAQKIQFIVATIAEPELLILDEPFSGLDPVNLEILREIVLELRSRGTTIIFSTHDMDVAERICDRIFMIYQGRKVLDGTLDEIKDQYGGSGLRVRLAGGLSVPTELPGVLARTDQGRFVNLTLESDAARPAILQALSAVGDVEHFETVRPTLHDIFVRIANPDDSAHDDMFPGET